jgi:antitoxin CptB
MMRPAADEAAEYGRVRWHCRRGLRELDVLLTRYAERHYLGSPPAERAAFRRLLESQDGVIYGYCLGSEPAPDAELSALIARITTVHGNDT